MVWRTGGPAGALSHHVCPALAWHLPGDQGLIIQVRPDGMAGFVPSTNVVEYIVIHKNRKSKSFVKAVQFPLSIYRKHWCSILRQVARLIKIDTNTPSSIPHFSFPFVYKYQANALG
ncbi:hypothetical protein BV898_07565 [Hypsibius exemplaris]|uniref:Uncharacterized protein n=1 Tax=Hypsibius exemplaris TaxID=2072580 RepID=A0A1W0WT42_HYPEX|nr:hypothetical protein BV898_07565 [Hypsibius exemplaris]